MSASKFRFVSPGVFINEIDNSQLPRAPEVMGPVIIGRSLRGPMMRPVKIQNFSDFVDVFGEPVAGGQGGDVWRDGNKIAPTYGAYAAQAYLRNSSPVTFIRLGGYENNAAAAGAGEAGWKSSNAYGLFVAPVEGTGGTAKVSGSAALAAIFYVDSTATVGLVGNKESGAAVDGVTNTWLRLADSNVETKFAVLKGGAATTSSINFADTSKKYIRNVLNTNPTLLSSKGYFLGETFGTFVKDTLVPTSASISSVGNTFGVALFKLKDFENFEQPAADANAQFADNQDPNSGWIISQHLAEYSSMTKNADGTYNGVEKLFKVVGLSEGEWNSQNLKITIEDIKPPANQFIKYGTFTLSVRRLDDNDVTPSFLERFTGLNLDPASPNYVAKRIGDKYTEWDYDKKAFVEYGTYDNQSKFIRIQMSQLVDNSQIEPSLLPFGFYGAQVATTGTLQALNGAGITTGFITGSLTCNVALTASFVLPEIPLLTVNTDCPVSSLSQTNWGLKTNVNNTKKHNKDIADVVRARPAKYVSSFSNLLTQSFMFSLDDISGTIVNNVIVPSSGAYWAEGNRKDNKSITATNASGSTFLLQTFNKFTMPLVGGFDGVDITVKDPFSKAELLNGNELDNYAYNSVKVAIESVSDAEVVEMNLAAMPGISRPELTSLLIDKCESRGDALAIIDLPDDYDPEQAVASDRLPIVADAVNNLKDRGLNSSYGCAYFPWVMIRDTINSSKVWVPPSVVALGTFSSSQKRTELWFAPAGFNRGGLSDGAAGLPVLQTALRLSSKDRDALYEANINPIASFPAEGIVVFGQKTLQATPSALDRINVRRLMIYLKKEISRFASSILFDPNVEVTWKRFLNLTEPFLASVQSNFGLSEYRVILDETTTTPDLVDRNVVYAKILLKPTRAIEFIALDFVITNTGASFAD